jgi:hypothetical protein
MFTSLFCFRYFYYFYFYFIDILQLRTPISSLSEIEFTSWIKQKISSSQTENGFHFIVNKKPICTEAFCAIFGISTYKFNVALETLDSPTIHGNALKKPRISGWKVFLATWFATLIATYCEIMPHSPNKYLPVYFTKEEVFFQAADAIKNDLNITISQSAFRKYWKENYKDVKISKNFKMGQCDFCLEIQRVKLQKGDTTAALKEMMSLHSKLHSASREYARKLRLKATAKSHEIMYLMYDGKVHTRMPHIWPLTKSLQTLTKLIMHVYGVSNFSENETQFYLFFPHWETGANVSVGILYDHILRSFQSMDHKRPSTLVIQVDNCVKEGKNKTILAFAAHLVHYGWFKKVKIISLIQGHTHDLIDQEFSLWAAGERRFSIESLLKISEFISKSFKSSSKKTSYTFIRQMFDWVGYFDQVLCDFSQHTDARLFKIYSENGHVVMKYKTNCLEKKWKGFIHPETQEEYGIQICHSYISFSPISIIPNSLSAETLNVITTNSAFEECLKPRDFTFWLNMAHDSTSYLSITEALPNESIIIIY